MELLLKAVGGGKLETEVGGRKPLATKRKQQASVRMVSKNEMKFIVPEESSERNPLVRALYGRSLREGTNYMRLCPHGPLIPHVIEGDDVLGLRHLGVGKGAEGREE